MARSLTSEHRSFSARSKLGATLTAALAMLGIAASLARESPARAGDGGAKIATQTPAADSGERERFLVEVQRRMTACQERAATIGAAVLAEIEQQRRQSDEALDLTLAVSRAEAAFKNATLTREISEIAVTEYELGIFKKDAATAEAEVKLCETQLSQALERIELLKTRLTKIKERSKESASDLELSYSYEDRIAAAELGLQRARFSLENAVSKLKVLKDYTRDKTIKELKSEVEKAGSLELQKKAEWTLAVSKLKAKKTVTDDANKVASGAPVLSALDQALSLVEKIRAESAVCRQDKDFDAVHAKAVRDLIDQFERLIAEAEASQAAARVDRIKPAIHKAANPVGRQKP